MIAIGSSMKLHKLPILSLPQGRKKNASTTGVVVGGVAGAAAAAQLAAAKQKDPSHSDFYRFQQREQRRNGEGGRAPDSCVAWLLPPSQCGQGSCAAGMLVQAVNGGLPLGICVDTSHVHITFFLSHASLPVLQSCLTCVPSLSRTRSG